MQRRESIHHSDLEVVLPTDLEQIVPPRINFEDKCYGSGPHQLPVKCLGQRYNSERSSQSTKASQRRRCNRPAFGLQTLIVTVCLAAALGGGLGGGLAAYRKSSPANCTTGSVDNSEGTPFLAIPTPMTLTKPTTGSASDPLPTLPASATSNQTTFVACPSPKADGAIYTATNRPLPILPSLQISNTSLYFLVHCNTNLIPYSGDSVLQTQGSISSLQDCIDACATYTWLAATKTPGQECSGVAWANGRVGDLSEWQNVCFLKADLTQPSSNVTSALPGYDGAVLLYQ